MPRHTDIDTKPNSRRCSTVVPSQIGSHEVYSHPLLRLWQNQIILPSLLVAALVSPQIRVVQNLLRLSGTKAHAASITHTDARCQLAVSQCVRQGVHGTSVAGRADFKDRKSLREQPMRV